MSDNVEVLTFLKNIDNGKVIWLQQEKQARGDLSKYFMTDDIVNSGFLGTTSKYKKDAPYMRYI